ncbi:hypothetical protein QBC47DRAFT_311024 [Echria macrotheca]|uniref:Uncharacterized protein n=1 Tax=Echria macrotheca TaxID=438768 RepID=A0AAJ0F407_9PEZI|nr:hypothetical protein QBC47DRAFT_311024 [Echria macrotheca]
MKATQFFRLASLLATIPSTIAQNCDEGTKLVCYGKPGGTAQNISLDDLEYVVAGFRGETENGPKFYTMPANPSLKGCDEWMMGDPVGSVLVLAKHTSNRSNSSVSLDEIANTIDGGINATPEQIAKSIMGCGTNGGQLIVQVNASSPVYQTEEYKALGAKPGNIVIKVVHAPPPAAAERSI